jgi:GNAT superfamily N-acetyltransferase
MLLAPVDFLPMPLPSDLRLRAAGPDDLSTVGALREAAGWGVHDWALRVAAEGPDARMLLAVDGDDRIAGVGSGISYGRLGFVGNMIVVEEHRRRGVGSAILGAVTEFLEERGSVRLELFATAAGRPLYERHGFELLAPGAMVRLGRDRHGGADPGVEVEEAATLSDVTEYDAARFGGRRTSVLAPMVGDSTRPFLVARRHGVVVGFAWLRPEDGRLGPFVADDPAVAATLVGAGFARATDAAQMTFNLPTSNAVGLAWLESIGAELETWDGRMGRGPQIERREETIYGNALGALG